MPEDNDKSANSKDKQQSGNGASTGRPIRNWSKRIYAVLGVVAVIGGVLAFGSQVEHWFSGLSQASDSTCSMPLSDEVERSPDLAISFHQDSQLALMDYVNSNTLQIPMIDVCLSSAPFEIWFPALGPAGVVRVCISPTAAIFHVNPLAMNGNVPGCLVPGTGVADRNYASGFLSESSPQQPAHVDITGRRAEPAANGDEKYFVSNLYSVPAGKKLNSYTIPMSRQTADLYVVIYTSDNRDAHGSDANVEHFALRFK
jgi:hypothetical protein